MKMKIKIKTISLESMNVLVSTGSSLPVIGADPILRVLTKQSVDANCGTGCKIMSQKRDVNEEMHKDPVNDGHSGASYGCTMRNMEFIAKNGYQAFKAEFNK
jgi:hypothetical protein